jgi:hypothetical protein
LKVHVEVHETELPSMRCGTPGDTRYTEQWMAPGLSVVCPRCGHEVEVYGTSDASERRACMMLQKECPRRERNYYSCTGGIRRYVGVLPPPPPLSLSLPPSCCTWWAGISDEQAALWALADMEQ